MAYLSSYQGDYLRAYRGDPFFGGIIRRIGSGIKGAIGGLVRGGPIGALGGAISGISRKPTRPVMRPISRLQPQQGFPGGTRVQRVPGVRGFGERMMPGGKTGYYVPEEMRPRRRRMNVANPKALRRAIRRQSGFVKLARKALKGTGYTIVSRGSRSRPRVSVRESGPGSVTVRG